MVIQDAMNISLSERTIEDILASDKAILAEVLSVEPGDLSLLARQKVLETGKLDLLYVHRDELLLIELKVVPFYHELIHQIDGYCECLRELQRQHRLVDLQIAKIALVTGADPKDIQQCEHSGIRLVTYEPEFVLSEFYERFRSLSHFLEIRSGDYGVVRLGLLKSTLQLLADGNSISQICSTENRAEKTIRNRLSVAAHLGLVSRLRHEYYLTDFADEFLQQGNAAIDDEFSSEQIEILSDFVRNNPYFSPITYTILSMLETVFVLAKNEYPVPHDPVRDYFVKSVGKEQTWSTARARQTATYIFSNYACELEYLARAGNYYYLTPKGIQAILLLQLNRSIKLIEARP